ncbi:MAG: L-aspartate oxidase [Gemmatimonadales bacterium]|nr:L-aspartate oxidase [Gemmatimonadales bacterium]MDZ4390952.1 L-aspartate oxidase [Gemmatimonadales bacterium]
MPFISARPLVVGTGIAGLWAAWRLASEGHDVLLATKATLHDSNTAWAQGGIAVALHDADSPEQHAADTIAASDGLADPVAVDVLTREGPERVRELLALGAEFDRDEDGSLRFGLEAAHSRARIIHAAGDRTGAMVVAALARVVKDHPRIEVREMTRVRRLVRHGDAVVGAVVLDAAGVPEAIAAPAVILATGGVGQLFEVTTNPPVATADGWALAHAAGAELTDLEFLQFHPTALALPGVNPAPLLTEALRGRGAWLVDQSGHRFVFDSDPRGELAPRDVVARAVAHRAFRGDAFLDARHLVEVVDAFPGVAALVAAHRLSLERDLLPIAPAMHYAMGGIRTDLGGGTTLRGLWAVGECAHTGVHGANRLASNSLLEGLVFADRAARGVGRVLIAGTTVPSFAPAPTDWDAGIDAGPAATALRARMRSLLTREVGLIRTEPGLAEAELAIADLRRRVPAGAWHTADQLRIAAEIARAARGRRESRGGHRRADFPNPKPRTAS